MLKLAASVVSYTAKLPPQLLKWLLRGFIVIAGYALDVLEKKPER